MSDPDHDTASLERELLRHALAQPHPALRDWRGEALEADLRETTAASVRTLTDDAGLSASRRIFRGPAAVGYALTR